MNVFYIYIKHTKLFGIGYCTMASNCKLQLMSYSLAYLMASFILITHAHTSCTQKAKSSLASLSLWYKLEQ